MKPAMEAKTRCDPRPDRRRDRTKGGGHGARRRRRLVTTERPRRARPLEASSSPSWCGEDRNEHPISLFHACGDAVPSSDPVDRLPRAGDAATEDTPTRGRERLVESWFASGGRLVPNSTVDYVQHSARSFRGEILDARGKGTDAVDPRDHERVTCDNDDFTCVSILALLVVSLFSETSRRRRAF